MEVQVPCRVHAEVPQEAAVWTDRATIWKCIRELARRKECQIEEGHLMPDHVHMLISIPPKYSVAEVIGYLKGKSSIWIAQNVRIRELPGNLATNSRRFLRFDGRDGSRR